MSTVHKILEKKGKELFSVPSSVTVYDALKEMAQRNIGAIIVMDGNVFKGLFTERDYARKVILRDRTSRDTFLHEVLDEDYFTVTTSTPINHCMNLITDHSIRYLPVLEDGEFIGLISVGDVVQYIIEDQQYTLHQMESYISDSRG
ncbi:MAG: CBS domain-containing protein [Fimbriimonadaceae bacterium]|nr:CBS domain-containing protein [Chitinophagales bacterium]